MEQAPLTWRDKVAQHIDPRRWLRALAMIDDTPHAIALGAAVGMFVGSTPFIGLHFLTVIALSLVMTGSWRFNKVAGLLSSYVNNPFTMLPMFWCSYKLGTLFFPATLSRKEFIDLFDNHKFIGWEQMLKNIFVKIGAPLIVGSLIFGLLISVPGYFLVRKVVDRIQKSRLPKTGMKDLPGGIASP